MSNPIRTVLSKTVEPSSISPIVASKTQPPPELSNPADTALQLQTSSLPHSNFTSPIEVSIAQERIRQARYSFNLALFSTAVSFCMGGILLLSGKLSEGAILASGGVVSSVCCVRLAKDANDRLDKLGD